MAGGDGEREREREREKKTSNKGIIAVEVTARSILSASYCVKRFETNMGSCTHDYL